MLASPAAELRDRLRLIDDIFALHIADLPDDLPRKYLP
jgi:hypothetical protein